MRLGVFVTRRTYVRVPKARRDTLSISLYLSLSLSLSIHIYIYIYIHSMYIHITYYIYIYTETEREREINIHTPLRWTNWKLSRAQRLWVEADGHVLIPSTDAKY